MNGRYILAACLILLVLVVSAWTQTAKPQPQWEYKVLKAKADSKIEQKLGELGAQGWELVGYEESIFNGVSIDAGAFFFKRAK